MGTHAYPPDKLWPLAVYSLLVGAVVASMLALSYVLGSRHRDPATALPYESGVPPVDSARLRLPADFYLVAMFFLIFDVEAVFLYAWAVSMRQTGWAGYAQMAVFVGVLVVGLVYLWGIGALDWGTSATLRRRRHRREQRDEAV